MGTWRWVYTLSQERTGTLTMFIPKKGERKRDGTRMYNWNLARIDMEPARFEKAVVYHHRRGG